MGGVQDTDVCKTCGEEYWYDFDTRTMQYSKLGSCYCDRATIDVKEFLKEKGLWEEFKEFHKRREKERWLERKGIIDKDEMTEEEIKEELSEEYKEFEEEFLAKLRKVFGEEE